MTSLPDVALLPLHAAVRRGDIDTARALLKAGAEVDARGESMQITPLIVAAGRGDAPMVHLLLEAGANPNASGRNGAGALARAVVSGDITTVSELLEAGASPDGIRFDSEQRGTVPPNTAPLWAAVALKRHDLVKLLLERGAQVNLGDSVTGTLFGAAVIGGDARIARMLLEAGADPLRSGQMNLPLLAVALRFTNLPMAELLEEYNLSLARTEKDG